MMISPENGSLAASGRLLLNLHQDLTLVLALLVVDRPALSWIIWILLK
jgi:hypothetical protein